MKQTPHLLIVAIALALAHSGSAEEPATLLVKWKEGPNSLAAVTGNAQIGSTVKRNFNALGWQLVELPRDWNMGDGMRAYQQLGTVVAVEPTGRSEVPIPVASTGVIPNDPMFSQQWYLKTIGVTNAWAMTTGSTNIVVAIIDTGVDYNHADLASNMWRNPGETGIDDQGRDKSTNGIDDDSNGYVDDVFGADMTTGRGDPMDYGAWQRPYSGPDNPTYHGTFIAGLIGAVGNNGSGTVGVNWSVRIMALRTTSEDWTDPTPTLQLTHAIAAFDYVLDMRRRGVNLRVTSNSYGNFIDSLALREAMARCGEAGILSVVAAGNSAVDSDVFSTLPATFDVPSVISVAASTENDTLASFSNFGRSTVDLAAPGINILSTWHNGAYQGGFAGSSFACPLVAGAAALLLAARPNLTVEEVKAALFGSVDQPLSMGGRLVTNGRLNVARALAAFADPDPPAIVVSALPRGQRTSTNASIRMTFSRSMNRQSVQSAWSIAPPLQGEFEWAANNRSFQYRPQAPLDPTATYTVRLLGTAQDESGGGLDGDFDRNREGSPADDFIWTFRFPIPNDDFGNRALLSGAADAIRGSNRYATFELSEPNHLGDRTSMSSVWYRWTPPPGNGWITFDLTSVTTFDSLLAVYQGQQLEGLTLVGENDNWGIQSGSRVSFPTTEDTSYAVVVAGKSGDSSKRVIGANQSGHFQLQWYPTPPPTITSFTPATAYPGQRITLTGTNFTGATRVLFNGVPAVFAFSTNAAFTDLQLTATVPDNAATGGITIETAHGNFTTVSNFTVLIRPALGIRSLPDPRFAELSWPSTTGFNLQRAESLASTTAWTAAAVVSSRLTNGIRYVTVTNVLPNRFFRLYRP